MATISFYAGQVSIANLNGSGLGFYGSSGFGASVSVNSYQDNTYITNSTGTTQGAQVWNTKWVHPNSGNLNGTVVNLSGIPNYQATLNVRFEHTSAVKTQNAELRIYDRSNINNPASGVTTKVAQIIHPDVAQTVNGSGDGTWKGEAINSQTGTQTVGGSGVVVPLIASPGSSGLRPNGAATTDTRHDWYTVISASPDSIGSKTNFGLYVSLEYL